MHDDRNSSTVPATKSNPYTWERIATEIYHGILDEGRPGAVPTAGQLAIVGRALSLFFEDLIQQAACRNADEHAARGQRLSP